MGKRTRRKRQGHNKTNNSSGSNANAGNGTASASDGSNPTNHGLLQRIRHSDPRTRHAALAAIATTLLNPTACRTHKLLSAPLLQAIRERVMDSDLEVSHVAAGCLANYLTIAAAAGSHESRSTSHSMTAGWTVLLLGRIQQCLQHLPAAELWTTAASSPPVCTKQHVAQTRQWYALTVQCLHPLCALMETNPDAVARLTSDYDATPRRDFHQTLFTLVERSCAVLLVPVTAIAPAPTTVKNKTNPKHDHNNSLLELSLEYSNQLLILAARTLHSAWDDNAALLLPWMRENGAGFVKALSLLQSMVTDMTTALPTIARLHAAGCLVSAWTLLCHDATATDQVAFIPTAVMTVLHPSLEFQWNNHLPLLEQWVLAYNTWHAEQEDDAMEREIIRKVDQRHESAKAIAKRQKQQGKPQSKMQQDDHDHDKAQKEGSGDQEDMEQEQDHEHSDGNDNDTTDGKTAPQPPDDTRDGLEQAQKKWNSSLLPLQVAMEILANLLTSGSTDNNREDDEVAPMTLDDPMAAWGPEQEAKLQQKQQQPCNLSSVDGLDAALQQALMERLIPTRLVELFQQVYTIPASLHGNVKACELARGDIHELQSKTMACLGNCIANVIVWDHPPALWMKLRQAATTYNDLNNLEAVWSVMAIAVRSRPTIRAQLGPDDLSLLLQQLQGLQLKGDENESLPWRSMENIGREVIGMLGVLCSQEPHRANVNQTVCEALVKVLDMTDSAILMCEVLNVLMDMYGGDDEGENLNSNGDRCYHGDVFESLQVLGHIQRAIPRLKQKLTLLDRQLNNTNDEDDPAVEFEQWNETMLNANRFVSYKKGQL